MTLAEKLEKLMEERHHSFATLQRASQGVDYYTIRRIVQGEIPNPKVFDLQGIATGLGLTLDGLLDGVSTEPEKATA